MLIDDVCESKVLNVITKGSLSKALAPATCFAFDDDVAEMLEGVCASRTASLLDSLKFAILPAVDLWIEMPRKPTTVSKWDRPGSRPISKVGFYYQARKPDELQCGMITQFWKHLGVKEYGMAVGSLLFDWSDPDALEPASLSEWRKAVRSVRFAGELGEAAGKIGDYERLIYERNCKQMDSLNEINKEAADRLGRTFELIGCPYALGLGDVLKENKLPAHEIINLREQLINDWDQEPLQALCAVLLLNCKNAVQFIKNPKDEKCRRRRVSVGKPYHSFRTVTLRLFEKGSPRALKPGEGEARRAHLVRGHFKCRSTGVYWWAPHIRGDSSLGFVHKNYEVETGLRAEREAT